MNMAASSNSTIQRERMKQGIRSLFVAGVLIGVGMFFAVAITQLSYDFSDFFLTLGGAQKLSSSMLPLNNSHPGQELLTVILNTVQVVMSLLIYIIYRFREIFLVVWIAVFPLFMSFYANDKTRGLAKMWWVEWIYQMLIPLGQSVVFGLACLIAQPTGSLSIADIFSSLAGTIGLLISAVYMRRIVDTVAQAFGASGLGHSAGETLMHGVATGLGFAAGDKLGSLGVKGSAKLAGKVTKKGFNAVDNRWGKKWAEKAIQNRPEVHAGAIQRGR